VCSRELPSTVALTHEDIERARPVAVRRVSQAGLRIADLLETAFEPGPLPDLEGFRPPARR